MGSVFGEIENSSINIKYIFIVVPIILIFLFTKVNVKLNILVALLFSILIILYINYKNQKEQKDIEDIYSIKKESLKPQSATINKYNDFVDFLFSIQDLYAYNPPAYEYVIENLEVFLQLYDDAKIAHELAGLNYGLADRRRQLALNNLHSIIYTLPTSSILIAKLNTAIFKLDDMLEKMLHDLYIINKNYIDKNGYTSGSIVTQQGPIPENYYEKEPFSFNIH